MPERGGKGVLVGVTAAAGVGRVAAGRAGRRDDGVGIDVRVRQRRKLLRPCRAAACAGVGFHTGLVFRGGCRDLAIVPRVPQRGRALDDVVVLAARTLPFPHFRAGAGCLNTACRNIVVPERGGVGVLVGISADAGVRRITLLGAGRGGDGDCVDVLMRLRNVHAVPCCRWVFFRAPCRCRPAVFSFDKVERQAGNVEISIDALIV